jgi:hypothetical protein
MNLVILAVVVVVILVVLTIVITVVKWLLILGLIFLVLALAGYYRERRRTPSR